MISVLSSAIVGTFSFFFFFFFISTFTTFTNFSNSIFHLHKFSSPRNDTENTHETAYIAGRTIYNSTSSANEKPKTWYGNVNFGSALCCEQSAFQYKWKAQGKFLIFSSSFTSWWWVSGKRLWRMISSVNPRRLHDYCHWIIPLFCSQSSEWWGQPKNFSHVDFLTKGRDFSSFVLVRLPATENSF